MTCQLLWSSQIYVKSSKWSSALQLRSELAFLPLLLLLLLLVWNLHKELLSLQCCCCCRKFCSRIKWHIFARVTTAQLFDFHLSDANSGNLAESWCSPVSWCPTALIWKRRLEAAAGPQLPQLTSACMQWLAFEESCERQGGVFDSASDIFPPPSPTATHLNQGIRVPVFKFTVICEGQIIL